MEAFGSIREGVTINIQRSDGSNIFFFFIFALNELYIHLRLNVYVCVSSGRIHHAVVTQLHQQSNSVSVEWCEKNETKGKEIELEALYALNAALLVYISLFSLSLYI